MTKISIGSGKLLLHTIRGLFSVALGSPHSLTCILQIIIVDIDLGLHKINHVEDANKTTHRESEGL